MKIALLNLEPKTKGEIRITGMTFSVECANCSKYILMSFPTKQKFIDYLTRFGWKCGYKNKEIWYCSECVKNFERSYNVENNRVK